MEADLSIPALRLIRVLRVPQRVQRAAGDDPGGQRAGVHLPKARGLVQGEQGAAGVHPTRQAHAERPHRALQRQHQKGAAQRLRVQNAIRGAPEGRGVDGGLQPPPAASGAELQNAGGIIGGAHKPLNCQINSDF